MPFKFNESYQTSNRPDLSVFGWDRLPQIQSHFHMGATTQSGNVPVGGAATWASTKPDGYEAVLDFENNSVWGTMHDDASWQASLDNWVRVGQEVVTENPTIKIGMYGNGSNTPFALNLMDDDFFAATKKHMRDNIRPEIVPENGWSYVAPVGYYYNNSWSYGGLWQGWAEMQRRQAECCRQLDVPAYLYLWGEFHDGTPYSGQSLPAYFTLRAVELALELFDGFILWDGNVPHTEAAALPLYSAAINAAAGRKVLVK